MGFSSLVSFHLFSRGRFTANKFQNVTNVKFRSENLFLILRLIINMSHFCKLGHRKQVLENFRKFISQERHIKI